MTLGTDWGGVRAAARDAGLVVEERPKEAFTRVEYQQKFGYGHTQAKAHIASLLEAGKIKKVTFRENGQRMTGYLLVEGK